MDNYAIAAYRSSAAVTRTYSTSFGLSIKLFAPELRPHIYAIYGLVRLADEIVDTYRGSDARLRLDELEAEVKRAIKTGYSGNPIVHAFALTAQTYHIPQALIKPFFHSMRSDLTPKTFDQKAYEAYIYGSAEVVGLMCLKVFTNASPLYDQLESGASALGAAYQKVNFLRDIRSDASELRRWYFPKSSFETFNDAAKKRIEKDIYKDLVKARKALVKLPKSSRKAVLLSVAFYESLLRKIEKTSAAKLTQKRIRINNAMKTLLFIKVVTARHHE
jgi:phytoene/squalene synthetase